MQLNNAIFDQFGHVVWFSHCGQVRLGDWPFAVDRIQTLQQAIDLALASAWTDALTHAQGELTEYLARTNYELYGSSWNQLADSAHQRLAATIIPNVNKALRELSAEALCARVHLDLTRIVLHSTYSRRFRHAPGYFQKLFLVYQRGHLPCGWRGDLNAWPEGCFVVY